MRIHPAELWWLARCVQIQRDPAEVGDRARDVRQRGVGDRVRGWNRHDSGPSPHTAEPRAIVLRIAPRWCQRLMRSPSRKSVAGESRRVQSALRDQECADGGDHGRLPLGRGMCALRVWRPKAFCFVREATLHSASSESESTVLTLTLRGASGEPTTCHVFSLSLKRHAENPDRPGAVVSPSTCRPWRVRVRVWLPLSEVTCWDSH